jgi:hypothetical protein
MPGYSDEQGGHSWPILATVCLLFLGLIVVLSRYRYRRILRFREQDRHWDTLWGAQRADVPYSLRRGDFNQNTRQRAALDYSRAQLVGFGNPAPTAMQVQGAEAIFSGEILSEHGGGYHLRHVIADNFLRRAVQHTLNSRLPERIALVRELFDAMDAQNLVTTWDDIAQRLQNGRVDRNWYQILGANRVDDLRRGLNNTVGQLFYSERQGNLLTGTHVDVTGDAIGIIGEQRVTRIVQAATNLMEALHLTPRLCQVENELFLGYASASGGYRQFGFNPLLSHDSPEDPLRLMGWGQTLRSMSRSDRQVVMRYLIRYHWKKTLTALLVILWSIWYGYGLPDFSNQPGLG